MSHQSKVSGSSSEAPESASEAPEAGGSSAAPVREPRNERWSAYLRVTAELLLPAAVLGLLVAGWLSWTVPADAYRVGWLVVEVVDEVTDPSIPRLLTNTNTARSGPATRHEVEGLFEDDSGEPLQVFLGDVVLWRSGEERTALAAAIWAGDYAVVDDAEEARRLREDRGSPAETVPQAQESPRQDRLRELPQKPLPEQTTGGAPAGEREGTAQGPRPAGPPRTSRRVVSGAILVALLRAERLGLESLASPVLGVDPSTGLDSPTASRAVGEGIRRAAPALRGLDRLYIEEGALDAESLQEGLGTTGLLSAGRALVSTPVARGELVAELDKRRPPALRSGGRARPQLNPLVRLETGWPTSPLPLVGFFLLVLVPHLRLAHEEPSRVRGGTGILLGLLAGVSFLALHELVLVRLWNWTPDSWIANEAGLCLLAAGAGALVGWSSARARDRWAPRTVSVERRDEMLQMAFHREVPVGTVEQDALGFRPMVEALRRFLDNAGTEPPVVLSVNGQWGSGKSSLMQMIRSELEKTRRFASVWFNAWRYQEEEQVMAAFLHTMARQLSRHWGIVPGVRLAWIRFRRLSALKMAGVLLPLVILVTALTVSSVRERAEQAGLSELGPNVVGFFAGLGGLGWVIHLARPFALRFRSLYQTKNHAERVGFLDEFTEEFRLYRQAIGDKKLLVIVDDLDRCDPEHIVAVLKAVNLIVTSAQGAGKTFFLLGFDPRYIIRAVELHYKDQSEEDPDFASQYLKKMVTLSVSVPRASSEAIAGLLTRLDQKAPADRDLRGKRLERWAARCRSLPSWCPRLLLAGALTALVTWTLVEALPPQAPDQPSVEARQEGVAPSPEGSSAIAGVLRTDTVEPPAAGSVRWWIWTAVMVVILFGGGLLFWQLRPTTVELRYRREETDSRRFVEALREARHLLPRNPRDAVRLVNLMRLTYLVQCAEAGREPLSDLPGPVLNEEETVALAALHSADPTGFGRLARGIVEGVTRESRGTDGGDREDEVAAGLEDIERFRSALSQATGSELAEGKLERYLAIHHYLLDVERIDQRKAAA